MPRQQYLFQTPDFEQSFITPRLKVNLGQSVRVQGRYDWMQSVGNPLSEWKEGMIECQKIWLNAQQLLRAPFPPNPSVTPFPSCYHFAISSFGKYKKYMRKIYWSTFVHPYFNLLDPIPTQSSLNIWSFWTNIFGCFIFGTLWSDLVDLSIWCRIYPSLSRWQLLPSPLSISWLQISQNPPGWIVYLQRNLKNKKEIQKKP